MYSGSSDSRAAPAHGAPVEGVAVLGRMASPEAVCITFICLADLLTTLYWVTQGRAREGNPVMAYFLSLGIAPFVVAKVSTFAPALVAEEWYRQHKPRLVERLLRWVIAAYLFLYIAGIFSHHGRVLEFYASMVPG